MLFVTTASQHFLSAAIDSLSNPTPPARWSHFSQRDMQKPSHSNDDTPFHKMLISTVTKYTVWNFQTHHIWHFQAERDCLGWPELSLVAGRPRCSSSGSINQADGGSKAGSWVSCSAQGAGRPKGHWWWPLVAECDDSDWLAVLAAAWLTTSWPSIWQWRWSQESVASKRQQRRPDSRV